MVEKFDCFCIKYAIVDYGACRTIAENILSPRYSSSLEIRKHVFELTVHLNFRHYRDDAAAKEKTRQKR